MGSSTRRLDAGGSKRSAAQEAVGEGKKASTAVPLHREQSTVTVDVDTDIAAGGTTTGESRDADLSSDWVSVANIEIESDFVLV